MSSALGSNKEIAEYMDSLHEIHDLVKLEEYEEVKQAVNNLVGASVVKDDEDSEDSDYLSKLKS